MIGDCMKIREFLLSNDGEWCSGSRPIRERLVALINESASFNEVDELDVFLWLNEGIKRFSASYLVVPEDDVTGRSEIDAMLVNFANTINRLHQ